MNWNYQDSAEQKMKFSIKEFFSKCGQIRRSLGIWPHLLKISLMENFIFCSTGWTTLLSSDEQHYLGCTIVLRTDCHVMPYFTNYKGLLTLAFWRTMMFTSIKHNFLLENIFFLSLTFSAFLQSLPLCVAAFFAINMHCFSEFRFVWTYLSD